MPYHDDTIMQYLNTISFLKQIDFFRNVSANYLVNVSQITFEETFSPGEILFKENDVGDSLYLITSGHVSVQKAGKEVLQLGTGQCVGEMAVLDRSPRSATIIAIDEVTALRIHADDLHEILADTPEIAMNLIEILVERLRKTTSIITSS